MDLPGRPRGYVCSILILLSLTLRSFAIPASLRARPRDSHPPGFSANHHLAHGDPAATLVAQRSNLQLLAATQRSSLPRNAREDAMATHHRKQEAPVGGEPREGAGAAVGIASSGSPKKRRGAELLRTMDEGVAPVLTREFRWLDQTLDHFSPLDKRTFPQRFFEHLGSFSPTGTGPIFLLICGEAPCHGIHDDYLPRLAAGFGGAVVALEHRYYGESVPPIATADGDGATGGGVEGLRFLSSRQALEDLATFRVWYQGDIHRRYNRSGMADNRWISVGISYAGALSAWFRLKYPHLVDAAVASSGVVQAILEYTAFDEQVAASAGPDCSDALRAVTKAVEEALSVNATWTLETFGADEVRLRGDFLYLMADAAAFAFQYGHPDALCVPLVAAHKGGGDVLAAYAEYVTSFFYKTFGVDPASYCRKHLVREGGSADRMWWFQTCTEVAYFQVAPPPRLSIRSSALNLEYFREMCSSLFGPGVFPDVKGTNTHYGGAGIRGSRIFFTNGSQDPWRQASKQMSSKRQPSRLIACHNCGHGTDFRGCPQWPARKGGDASSCTSPEIVLEVREDMRKHLRAWTMLDDEQGLTLDRGGDRVPGNCVQ